MRVFDALLGGLLLTSGFLGPIAGLWTTTEEMAPAEGFALLSETDYQGNATLEATDAMLSERGPYNVSAQANSVRVTLYSYEMHEAVVVAKYGLAVDYKPEVDKEKIHFRDAEIALTGDETGILHVWPGENAKPASFAVNLSTEQQRSLIPSKSGGTFYSVEGEYHHNIRGPAFGLGHGTAYFQEARLSQAVLQGVDATGSLQIVATNGTLEIDHNGSQETYELHSDPGSGQHVGVNRSARAGVSVNAHGTFAVLDFSADRAGTVSSNVEADEAIFFAHEPQLHVDGNASFTAAEGKVRADGTNRTLHDDRLEIAGNLSMDLAALGQDDLSGGVQKGWRLPAELLDEPVIETTFEGDADEVRVNGNQIASGSTELQEDITLIGKILGALLLVWSIGRRLLFLAVGLVTGDPLGHPRRQTIHEVLEDQGLAYLREIQRVTEIPLGSVAYHLRVLKAAGLVTSVKKGGYRVYFLSSCELPREQMERLALLANGTRKEIAQVIARSDGVSQEELANQVGKSQNWLSRLLSEFEEAGLVDREGDWRSVYRASPLLERWFAQL